MSHVESFFNCVKARGILSQKSFKLVDPLD